MIRDCGRNIRVRVLLFNVLDLLGINQVRSEHWCLLLLFFHFLHILSKNYKYYLFFVQKVAQKLENRTFSNPINLIHICGLADDVVPQDGSGKIEDGWGGAPHIDTITKYWADVAKLEKYNTKQLTTNTSKESYTSAHSKYEVQCIKIKGHGHDYPGPEHDVDAGELMWNFFDKFITK